MRFPLSILAIAALGHVTAVAAPTHVFDFTFDGSSTTTNLSAAGQQLMDGETVGLTLRAASNDHFEANGSYVWVPLAMGECGTRIGDLSYSFWLDGVELASGSYAAHGHSCVHIANSMALPSMLAFDELRWEFLQISTTTATNTLGNLLSMTNPTLSDTRYVVGSNPVPEPGTWALTALALLAAAGAVRRRQAN